MTTPEQTPQTIAAELARSWTGTIENVRICEDLHGWTVHVSVKPDDTRKRTVRWSESGETRSEAIAEALSAGAYAWPSVFGMLHVPEVSTRKKARRPS